MEEYQAVSSELRVDEEQAIGIVGQIELSTLEQQSLEMFEPYITQLEEQRATAAIQAADQELLERIGAFR